MNSTQHILSVKNMTEKYINTIINFTIQISYKNYNGNVLSDHILTTVFFEPSTRTACSFQAAMLKLGGSVISLNEQYSSVVKGESLKDTIRTVATYSDVIVLRHPLNNSMQLASSVSNKPIINAGNGTDEHPTQALLDMYTIVTELKVSHNRFYINIVFMGDLKNGRTVHSLIYILLKYNKLDFIFTYCSPPELALPKEIYDEIAELGIEQNIVNNLNEAVALADVLYVTRVQKERFSDLNNYEQVKSSYVINKETMKFAKENMIVMHPFPRVDEIDVQVDDDPRAVYFKQMENGLYVRMAILLELLTKDH